jgi:hypothetical protein
MASRVDRGALNKDVNAAKVQKPASAMTTAAPTSLPFLPRNDRFV